jgi:hypothetical protein
MPFAGNDEFSCRIVIKQVETNPNDKINVWAVFSPDRQNLAGSTARSVGFNLSYAAWAVQPESTVIMLP